MAAGDKHADARFDRQGDAGLPHQAANEEVLVALGLLLMFGNDLRGPAGQQIARRTKAAWFREATPWDEFNWSFNPSIHKKHAFDLATCRFTGKSYRLRNQAANGDAHDGNAEGDGESKPAISPAGSGVTKRSKNKANADNGSDAAACQS